MDNKQIIDFEWNLMKNEYGRVLEKKKKVQWFIEIIEENFKKISCPHTFSNILKKVLFLMNWIIIY